MRAIGASALFLVVTTLACRTPGGAIPGPIQVRSPVNHGQLPELRTGYYTIHAMSGDRVDEKQAGLKDYGRVAFLTRRDLYFPQYRRVFKQVVDGIFEEGFGELKTQITSTTPNVFGATHLWVRAGKKNQAVEVVPHPYLGTQDRPYIVATFAPGTPEEDKIAFRFHSELPPYPRLKVLAHQGVFHSQRWARQEVYPANTLPALEAALHMGFPGFQIDVRPTKSDSDGESHFVLHEKDELDGTTNCKGNISDQQVHVIAPLDKNSPHKACRVQSSEFMSGAKLSASISPMDAELVSLQAFFEHFFPTDPTQLDRRLKQLVINVPAGNVQHLANAMINSFFTVTDKKYLEKIIIVTHYRKLVEMLRKSAPRFYDVTFALAGPLGVEGIIQPDRFIPRRNPKDIDMLGAHSANIAEWMRTHAVDDIRDFIEQGQKRGYKMLGWTFSARTSVASFFERLSVPMGTIEAAARDFPSLDFLIVADDPREVQKYCLKHFVSNVPSVNWN